MIHFGFKRFLPQNIDNEKLKRNKKLVYFIPLIALLLLLLILIVWITDIFKPANNSNSLTNNSPVSMTPTISITSTDGYRISENEKRYADANIPYYDPQGRFFIHFLTPYVSDQVVVVFKNNKDYDEMTKEADAVIAEAKKKVSINQVSYVDEF